MNAMEIAKKAEEKLRNIARTRRPTVAETEEASRAYHAAYVAKGGELSFSQWTSKASREGGC